MYPFDCSLSADVKAEGRLDPFSRLSTKHATQPEYELGPALPCGPDPESSLPSPG